VANSVWRLYRPAIVRAVVVGAAVAHGPKVRPPVVRAQRLKRARANNSNSSVASVARVSGDRAAVAIANAVRAAINGAKVKARIAKRVTVKDAMVKEEVSAAKVRPAKVSPAMASGAIAIVDRGAARAASPSAKAATAIAAAAAIGAIISRRRSSIPSNRWSIAATKMLRRRVVHGESGGLPDRMTRPGSVRG